MDRRGFLKRGAAAAVLAASGSTTAVAGCGRQAPPAKADYTLRIGHGLVELAPDRVVSTTLYNGQFPGPLLRFTEG
jgi:FtsP/CotA-like multicopper oxidase with cupredoxin domain